MSVESLTLYIREKTQERIVKINEEADAAAARIIQDAETKASVAKEQTLSRLKKEMDEREKAELSQARIESKKRIMLVKESCLEKVSKETYERLKATAEKGDPDYVSALLGFATEAVSSLGGERALVLANARDGDILRKHLPEISRAASQSGRAGSIVSVGDKPIATVGGVLAQTDDGRRIFGNTLETRIDSTFKKLRGELLAALFEGE